MITQLGKWLVSLGLVLALCGACYLLGRADAEVKIVREQGREIIKEVEVIKYVERKKKQIWIEPNANRDELLKLMQDGQL